MGKVIRYDYATLYAIIGMSFVHQRLLKKIHLAGKNIFCHFFFSIQVLQGEPVELYLLLSPTKKGHFNVENPLKRSIVESICSKLK